MRIPSYDDLTPSIPDITPRETCAAVGRLLPASAPARRGVVEPSGGETSRLFACLRSARAPETIVSIARDFSPRIERHGPSAVVLDVSGLGRLLGDAQAIGTELDRAASAGTGAIRVAVAPTQAAALLLATRSGLTVATGEPAEALADLPLDTLRVLLESAPGIRQADDEVASRLGTFRRWGLKTLGDLAALPPAELSERMGQPGLALQRLARGLDDRPIVPDPGVPRFTASLDLEWPIDTLEPLSFVLARLLDPLSASLERADRAAAAIRLDLRLVDRTTHARMLQLPAAMRDARILRTLLLLDLESHPPSAGVDVVAIEVDPAPSRIVQYSLLDRALPSVENVATLMARLRALVGEDRCGSPSLLDTHRPDGFELVAFAPAGHGRRPPVGRASVSDVPGADVHGEPGAGAGWPARREPAGRRAALRRFRPPVAVRVTVERGRPVSLAVDRRGMPGGRIGQQAGPWRSSGDWWDATGRHWDRDEWDVACADGSLCRLYCDRASGQWFLDGVLD